MAKLIKVTNANIGPRSNVAGALNNALVTVQDHNKVINAVNLLIDDDTASRQVVVKVLAATVADTTTDFAEVLVGDLIVHTVISTGVVVIETATVAVTAETAPANVGDLIQIYRTA